MPKHFWLGGSIAERALACPGSLNHPSDGTSSAAADRGTLLHDAMTKLTTGEIERPEHAVGMRYQDQTITQLDARTALLPALRAAETWIDGAPARYEVKVKFKSIRSAGGTADILAPHGIADYKFGSKPVNVRGNKQMMFYAAAALECGELEERSTYDICIIQPAVKRGPMVSTVYHDELIEITAKLKEAAANARSSKPRYAAGDHCLFCPARRGCKYRLESPFAALKAALKRTEPNRTEPN